MPPQMTNSSPSSRNWYDAFLPVSFLFMTFCAALFRLSNYDIWWHLAAGRFILSGGGIPRTDPFSYTAVGHPWIDHEWLFQCVVYLLHQLGGPPALVIAKALLLVLTAGIIYRFVLRETNLPPALIALMLTPFMLAGRDRFLVRPELFTLFFSAILLTALYRTRPQAASFRRLWWLCLLFIPWANLHGGMILGIVILAAYLAGCIFTRVWPIGLAGGGVEDNGRPNVITALGLLGGSMVCGLVNPFLHQVYLVPFQLTSLIESGIYHNLEWIRPQWPASWIFYFLVGIAAVVVLGRLKRPDWPAIFPLLFLMAISLQYVRNIGLFSLLSPILLTALIPFRRRAAGSEVADAPDTKKHLRPGLVSIVLFLLGITFLLGDYRFASGVGVDPRRAPVRAVDFLESAQPPGNLLNAYVFGGYAAWRLWPEVRIFIDGRNEVFADLRAELAEAVSDSRVWTELLNRYDIGYALLEYIDKPEIVTLIDPEGGPPLKEERPYAVNHFPRQAWALVYWDDTAMVYLRRTPETASLIKTHAYEHVYPENINFQLQAIARNPSHHDACVRELRRKLQEDPDSQRALELFAAVEGSTADGRRDTSHRN